MGWIIIAVLLLATITGGHHAVFAQTPGGSEYFPETGHWVTGDFLLKYESVPNPEEIFGKPITEAITDLETGLRIQYFEKARFELRPSENDILRVRFTPLGSLLYEQGQALPLLFNSAGCRFFSNIDQGYYVCYDFLTFFEENGGVAQFGYPISNFELRDGWIVQYFQRARFEWHPEYPSGEWVKVSNLGKKYFQVINEDPLLLSPNRSFSIPYGKTNDLIVRAFVSRPIVNSSGNQTLNIIVQDQYRNPVENAQLSFTVKFPDGKEESLIMNNTGSNGVSSHRFYFDSQAIGTVEVIVTVHFDSLEKQTKTSFQIWW